MNWVDACGPPGSGKSTLCDPLWGPHELPIENKLPPEKWHDFLNEVTRLFLLIRGHWSFDAAIRMNNRSIRKMATVARTGTISTRAGATVENLDFSAKGPYIQTGLVQRGLGFGWRINDLGLDIRELTHFFRLMPVSIGVAVTRCPPDEVIRRNQSREEVKETAHENRGVMALLMQPAIELAVDILDKRGVPILEIDTTGPVDKSRKLLCEFANRKPFDAEASGRSCEIPVLSPPPWWV